MTHFKIFHRSPNPSSSLNTWPSYKSPNWTYLNLTVGEVGLTGTRTMNSRCTFWNRILPAFISERVDEKDDDEIAGTPSCKDDDFADHSGDGEMSPADDGKESHSDGSEESIADELPLYSFIDIESK